MSMAVLPLGPLFVQKPWVIIKRGEDGVMLKNKPLGLTAIISDSIEQDNRWWRHLSVSRKSRIPTYEDLALVKKLFLRKYKAVQVFPREDEHVNIHPNCLHLFATDNLPLPDFTQGTGSI